MPNSKADRDRVATKQNKGSELSVLLRKWDISRDDLKTLMLEIGPNGKSEVSRKDIETELEKRQYKLKEKKPKKS